jgi:hypothetical protein
MVYVEGDKVCTELNNRAGLLILSPLQGEQYADALDAHIAIAEKEPPEINQLAQWNVHVTNRDHKVVLKFTPPPGENRPDRVPMSVSAARAVVSLVRTNVQMAGFGLRIERVC